MHGGIARKLSRIVEAHSEAGVAQTSAPPPVLSLPYLLLQFVLVPTHPTKGLNLGRSSMDCEFHRNGDTIITNRRAPNVATIN